MAEKNRKWRKKILELAGDQSQNMVTMVKARVKTIEGRANQVEGRAKPVNGRALPVEGRARTS